MWGEEGWPGGGTDWRGVATGSREERVSELKAMAVQAAVAQGWYERYGNLRISHSDPWWEFTKN